MNVREHLTQIEMDLRAIYWLIAEQQGALVAAIDDLNTNIANLNTTINSAVTALQNAATGNQDAAIEQAANAVASADATLKAALPA